MRTKPTPTLQTTPILGLNILSGHGLTGRTGRYAPGAQTACPLAVASAPGSPACVCTAHPYLAAGYLPPLPWEPTVCEERGGGRGRGGRGRGEGRGGEGRGRGLSVPGSLPPAGCQRSGRAATCVTCLTALLDQP